MNFPSCDDDETRITDGGSNTEGGEQRYGWTGVVITGASSCARDLNLTEGNQKVHNARVTKGPRAYSAVWSRSGGCQGGANLASALWLHVPSSQNRNGLDDRATGCKRR